MTKIQPTTLQFLRDLREHNDRNWFQTHKARYDTARANMVDFADALLAKMNAVDRIETESGKKSLFRIYRDVRFSKNKAPYKTNMSGSFARATALLRGGYYFSVEPDASMVGGGFWAPERDDLKRIRTEIAADAQPLRDLLADPKLIETYGGLSGDQLKTAPRDFPKDHPDIDLLRYKQYLLTRNYTDREVLAKDFLEQVFEAFVRMRPFFGYMSEVLTTDENGVSLYE